MAKLFRLFCHCKLKSNLIICNLKVVVNPKSNIYCITAYKLLDVMAAFVFKRISSLAYVPVTRMRQTI